MTDVKTAPAIELDEDEALELENLLAVDTDPATIALIMSFKAHREARNNATKELEKLKAKILKQITAAGKQGLTIGGRVEARRSVVVQTRVDPEKLKQEMPEVWAKFAVPSTSIRLTVSQ